MAHVNTASVHIPLGIDSPMSSIGWGQSPSFPTREGTFFGHIMVTNSKNALDGYFCNGPGTDVNTVPGRLGGQAGSAYVPYANAFPPSAGMDGLCDTNHSTGTCATNPLSAGEKVTDGNTSCTLNGHTWSHPVTVWRGQTFQAENAVFDVGQSAAPQACSPATNCGSGKRVSWIRPGNGLTINNVSAAVSGTNNLVIYYTNGDPVGFPTRTLSMSVNGGPPQYWNFAPTGNDWDTVASITVSLTGFVGGRRVPADQRGGQQVPGPDVWLNGERHAPPAVGLQRW